MLNIHHAEITARQVIIPWPLNVFKRRKLRISTIGRKNIILLKYSY